jgi:uncharacterized protein
MNLEPLPEALQPPPPERFPFWGYADVFLLAGLAVPCLFLGWGAVRLVLLACGLHVAAIGVEAVAGMMVGYVLLALVLKMIFRMQYGKPFWSSLGWTKPGMPIGMIILAGLATGFGVNIVGWLLHTPPASGPLTEMMKDRTALILIGIFGTTAGPLFEELAFRGFLQPLFVKNLGAVVGIGISAVLFGALHYSEYGNSWRLALLVALAGAAFGCMRQFTGSTLAAFIMHAAFNSLSFVSMLGR